MAETPPKRTAKPERDEPSVLGKLPASRPERLGRPRGEAAKKRPAKKRVHGTRASHGPAAVRPASPPLRAARASEPPPPPKPLGAPSGTELVTTTIRAAGELAQIGFTVGGQVLKRTLDRLPRP